MLRPSDKEAQPTASMPSVLDLLLEDQPVRAANVGLARGEMVRSIKRALLRDLEWLLNTRRCGLGEEVEKSLTELQSSVVSFGIPDFTAMDFASDKRRAEMARMIERAIRQFETRISDVSVTLVDTKRTLERRLHLRIEALIRVEPVIEAAVFESMLDPASQSFSVWAADHE